MAARTVDNFVRGYSKGGDLYDWYGRFVGSVDRIYGTVKDRYGRVIGSMRSDGKFFDVEGNYLGEVWNRNVYDWSGIRVGEVDSPEEAALLLFPLFT